MSKIDICIRKFVSVYPWWHWWAWFYSGIIVPTPSVLPCPFLCYSSIYTVRLGDIIEAVIITVFYHDFQNL